MDREQWPRLLWPLLEEHGVEKVWRVALRELDYPPTWGVVGKDYERLMGALS